MKDSFRWLGSYWLEPCETLEAATEAAEKERRERGGKYGFLIFKNGAETAVLGCFGTEALETYPGYVM